MNNLFGHYSCLWVFSFNNLITDSVIICVNRHTNIQINDPVVMTKQ